MVAELILEHYEVIDYLVDQCTIVVIYIGMKSVKHVERRTTTHHLISAIVKRINSLLDTFSNFRIGLSHHVE